MNWAGQGLSWRELLRRLRDLSRVLNSMNKVKALKTMRETNISSRSMN